MQTAVKYLVLVRELISYAYTRNRRNEDGRRAVRGVHAGMKFILSPKKDSDVTKKTGRYSGQRGFAPLFPVPILGICEPTQALEIDVT